MGKHHTMPGLLVRRLDTVPKRADDRITGRCCHRFAEDARRGRSTRIKSHSLHLVAKSSDLDAHVLHDAVDLRLPIVEYLGRRLHLDETPANGDLHFFDPCGLQLRRLRHRPSDGLELIKDHLHRTELLADRKRVK